MDVLAHGLWGSLFFGRKSWLWWAASFLIGMAPDLIAFGPYVLSRPRHWMEFPPYVYQTYNVTHSLLVWGCVTIAVWVVQRRFPWILGAWALHILCDIPLHDISFFPTPYLWPLMTPLIDGVRWAQPAIMIPNYAALVICHAIGFYARKGRNET